MGKGKAKGLPKELLTNPNIEEWRKAMLTSNPDEEVRAAHPSQHHSRFKRQQLALPDTDFDPATDTRHPARPYLTRVLDTWLQLMELYGMFKKCAGKDKKLSRAEFLKNFTKKVTVTTADGKQPVEVADVEKLFNACAIDYNYDDVSVHECVLPASLPSTLVLTAAALRAGSSP